MTICHCDKISALKAVSLSECIQNTFKLITEIFSDISMIRKESKPPNKGEIGRKSALKHFFNTYRVRKTS
jgi:hypothetical protein